MKHTRWLIAIAVFIAIFGVSAETYAQDPKPPSNSYKILPGDILEVSVWREEDLQREVLIRPDGAFSFPLCGDISATNKTVVELQQELSQRLSRYISDPVVTVSVTQILGNKIYVIGQVKRPGDFVVNPLVDVVQALSMAGGGTPFAKLNDIKILRRTNGTQRAISFRYDEVSNGKNLSQNIVLQSGDVVIVP